jgi:ATPase subunit of ABC transporter with duplicated ATPase domains
LLKVTSLSKHFHAEPLFADVDLVLGPGDRVGLVGPNGAGKSTLLRVLTGQEPPSSGRVELGPGTRLGYFAQQIPDPQAAVGAFLRDGLAPLFAAERRMRDLAARLAAGAGDSRALADYLADYAAAQERWTALRGWTAEPRLAEIRQRLDIAHLPDDARLVEVSGGEQARLMLGRVLLARARCADPRRADEPSRRRRHRLARRLPGRLPRWRTRGQS